MGKEKIMRHNNYPDNLEIVANQKVKEKKYWLEKLSGEWTKSIFPYSCKKEIKQNYPAALQPWKFSFSKELFHGLMKLSAGMDVKLYMVLAAGLVVLASKYTGNSDIIFGSPIYKQYINSKFVNTVLVLRIQLRHDVTFKELLLQIRQTIVKANEYCNYPVEVLAKQLGRSYREEDDFPLFDIVILLENIHDKRYLRHINCNMRFLFERTGEGVEGVLEYNPLFYERWTIKKIIHHFLQLFRCVLFNLDGEICGVDILSAEEKKHILEDFNKTASAYPKDKTIHVLFEEQVEKVPDRTAVVFGQENLTYKVLDQQANRLANYLRDETGVVPDQPVGLLMDRSISIIIAILGILKASGAYIPISTSFPEHRIKTMIDDSGIRTLISQKRYIKTLNRLQWECKNLDTFLCLDSRNVHGEKEQEPSELMSPKLWEYVGETAIDEIAGGGWNSSYTGNPIPKEEMDEYGDNVLKKLEPFLHKKMKVLEIGAASGISMYRLAPRVGLYYGTDLSGIIIEKNRERIKKEGHKNIKLRTLAAHEIAQLEERNFDLVILNSVIQCFHGHNYLRNVIRKIIDLMGSSGNMFIGDIMDQELREDLIADLVTFKQENRGKNYKTKIDWSEELFISRSFLEDLMWDYPEIHDMEFSRKIHTIENELTKFRYDVLIHIDKANISSPSKYRMERHKHQHDARVLGKYGTGKLCVGISSDNLSYVIYTSGSTGQPRGTLTTHYNVTRVVRDTNYIEFRPEDRVLQLSDYAFDGSVFDIYGALLNGSTLVMVSREDILEMETLCRLIQRERISIFFVTTALFNTVVDVGLESLSGVRKLLFGGERVSVNHAAKALAYLDRDTILHMYGPTETTVYATYYTIDAIDANQSTIPIGGPIANTWIYVLDRCFMLVPIDVTGEIYIGGPGVCRGYMNNPELTEEKFQIPKEFQIETFFNKRFLRGPGGSLRDFVKRAPGRRRLYKTGDMGRWLNDGNIEFIGRMDHQVKVRGFRIELGEIESCLSNYVGIKECKVTTVEDERGSRYLCAYMKGDEKIEILGLKDYLSQSLPDYMIPSYFVQMDQLPLGRTGKVDGLKLPDPRISLEKGYVAPRDEIEERIVDIWSEVLGIGKKLIGIDSNFFELGGHSLKATVLMSELHKELGVKVPLAEVFSHQTVRDLSEYIRHMGSERYSSIENVEEKEYYALSAAQKRLYIIQQMEFESTRYNMPYIVPLEDTFDKERLKDTFRKLIKRHESFRTSFHAVNDQPVQKIHNEVDFTVEYYDFAANLNFNHAFDLSKAPLLRAGVIHTSQEGIPGDNCLLLVEMHHIVSDGTSQAILEREFALLYAGEDLPKPRLRYRDYSEWQNSETQQAIMKEHQKYWLNEFSSELPILDLPTDYPRPLVQNFEGRRLRFFINQEISGSLQELGKKTNSTLYMSLLSVYTILLAKLSSQEDIIIGTPTAGRRHADLLDIIGMFVNTLSMRNYPLGDKKFIEFLQEVKERTLKAYENQEYQYEDLVDNVSVRRDTSRNPIFDVMFNFLNQADYQGDITGKDLDIIHDEGESKANFDLTFQGAELDGVLYFTVDYCMALYNKETLVRFINYFKKILMDIKENPTRAISSLELISEKEKKQLLVDFNATFADYPRSKTIHELFEEQAEKNADGMALVGSWQLAVGKEKRTGETLQLTYGELNQKSDQLAYMLRERGLLADDIVAIMMERSIEMIIGILGILKAGGAYLPIDPVCPEERKQYMLTDSCARILLTNLSEGHHIDFTTSQPTNLAYIIYTSGTTGRPKAILTTHSNVVRVVRDTNYIKFQPGDRVLQLSDFAFDGSVFDIFGALLNGCILVIVSREDILEIETLCRFIERERISVFFVTTALFNTIVDVGLESLSGVRKVLFGGERVSVNHAAKALAYMGMNRILHMYGPTETTVYATYYPIDAIDKNQSTIPIGGPVANTWISVLDSRFMLVPIGVTGEIYISGLGVCRGYMNNPELTAEKFLVISYKSYRSYRTYISEKLYKTGDLGRWLNDGNIEFIGRVDTQVKVRGFRIELGEIESRLLNYISIKECTVTAVEDEKGSRYLCAYIVGDEIIEISELRDYLSQFFPDFMIPSYIVQMDKLPLGKTGKIERSKLPDPRMSPAENCTAPRDEIEEKIVEIWSRVLGGAKTIGIDDDFFELGGHSLKATVMVAQIHRQLHMKVPLGAVFKYPTIRELCQYIRKSKKERFVWIPTVEQKEYYPLSAAQKRLYIMQHMGVDSVSYNQFMVLVLAGNVQKEKLQQTFSKLIQRHESLRTSFKIVEEEPVQKIYEREDYKFQIKNYKQNTKENQNEMPSRNPRSVTKLIENFLRPFDLSKAPLLRVGLIEIGHQEHILMLDMHHIISDGTSLDIFAREFVALYSGRELPGLRIQYKDFSQWQNRLAIAGEIDRQEAYWLRQFAGEIPRLNLPGNSGDASTFSKEGSTLIFEVGKELTLKIKNLISAAGTTTYMVLLAIYNILLSKYTGQEDIVVGSGIAGRRHTDLQHVIGMFVNMLSMRNRPQDNKTFLEFLREVKENALSAFENQDYQFDQLVEKLKVQREPGRNPIFDTQFTFQSLVSQVDEDDFLVNKIDFAIKPYEPGDRKINMQFDLSLSGAETADNIIITLEYVKALYTDSYARGMTEHFIEILKQVVEDRHMCLKDISISHELQTVKSVLKEEDVYDYEF
jgi:amino acid adenylation domain-containing protein